MVQTDASSSLRAQAPCSLSSLLNRGRLPALDGLRAVAVAIVIAYHAGASVPGDLGVLGFFVLSGFLITWLLIREHERTGTIALRSFYLRRTLRIVPAYVAFVLVMGGIYYAKHHEIWGSDLLLAVATYTTNYYNAVNDHPPTGLAHLWSLAVEEQFYLLWPFLFLLLLRGRRDRLVGGLILAIGCVLAWRTFAYVGLRMGSAYAYNTFETRFDALAIGCLLAALATRGRLDRVAALVSCRWPLPLLTLGLLAWSRTGSPDYHYGVGFTIDGVLIALLMVQLLLLVRAPFWSWLEHPIVRYLGTLSYPLYLYHGLGLCVGRKLGGLPAFCQTAIGLLACLALACASYYLVERPFLALKQRWATDASRGPAGASDPTAATDHRRIPRHPRPEMATEGA